MAVLSSFRVLLACGDAHLSGNEGVVSITVSNVISAGEKDAG